MYYSYEGTTRYGQEVRSTVRMNEKRPFIPLSLRISWPDGVCVRQNEVALARDIQRQKHGHDRYRDHNVAVLLDAYNQIAAEKSEHGIPFSRSNADGTVTEVTRLEDMVCAV